MSAQQTEKFEILNRWTGAVQVTAKITCAPDASVSVKLGLAVRWAVKSDAYLAGANLARAYLADAYLAGANLADANLAGANLARANLADANLAGANLAGANLADAYLADANLAGAYLADAYLAGANLARANLADAYLAGANLADAYLAGANLARAYLADAYLAGANLADANLADAYLADANLAGANLRPIKADFFMILAMGHHEVSALISALKDGRVDGSTYSGDCACLVGTLENAGATNIPHEASSPAELWFSPIRKGVKPGDEGEGGFRSAKALEWAEEYAARTGILLTA